MDKYKLEPTMRITREDLERILRSVGISRDMSPSEVSAYIDDLEKAANTTSRNLFKTYVDAQTVTAQPTVETLALIRQTAWRDASKLTTNMLKSQIEAIHTKIADGVNKGISQIEIGRSLKSVVTELDNVRAAQLENYIQYLRVAGVSESDIAKRAERYKKRLLRSRRETIAGNESHIIMSTSRAIEAETGGAIYKAWITMGDGKVSDICAGNEAAGLIKIKDKFPSSHDRPPGHVRCRCNVAYYSDEKTADWARKRIDERIENTARQRALAEARDALSAA